ncbi:hypothetical protein CDAR_255491 [Caerostris darwini]|uniref:Uncharacterized protein n=1 Tax=Caerostris darwini TaxID=1538125 RepID=A0AAV4NPW0_9ARAC|nr:hypothetical protein CDAR_255491 [Caerostris darwini]
MLEREGSKGVVWSDTKGRKGGRRGRSCFAGTWVTCQTKLPCSELGRFWEGVKGTSLRTREKEACAAPPVGSLTPTAGNQ